MLRRNHDPPLSSPNVRSTLWVLAFDTTQAVAAMCPVDSTPTHFEVEHQLGPTRVGHRIEVSLQVGRAAGILLLDDIEVWAPRDADGRPPRLLPPPLPSEPSR